MRKKIRVRDLRLGMFVDELCGSWMDHPFWKKSFKLTDPKDLKSLHESYVQEVWIDTSRGLDVEAGSHASSEAEEQQKTAEVLQQAVAQDPVIQPHVPIEQEITRARVLHAKAKAAVVSMFKEARMGKAIEIGAVAGLVDEINQSVARNPGALLSLAKLKNKDDYTYLHSVAVCALMIALGKQLGLQGDELKSAGMAGLLHDIGKMGIPDEILNKPGRLTDEEFDIIKEHPRKGWEILKESYGVDDTALEVCLYHHERTDGTGYPSRRPASDFSMFVRMGSVCDVYDAITSNRAYKNAWSPAESIRKMAEWQENQFDHAIFHAFVKTVGIYPAGTLVRLRSGRLGVVTDQSPKNLLTPRVKVFFSTKSNAPIPLETIDLSGSQDAILETENPAKWGFDLSKITGI